MSNEYPQYAEGDYSPDRNYRLYNGGWIPAAEYPESPLDLTFDTAAPPAVPPTPWYKQKAFLAIAAIGGVLTLIGVGFAAGNGEETASKSGNSGSAWVKEEPTVTEPPEPVTPPKAFECATFIEERVINGIDVQTEHLGEGMAIVDAGTMFDEWPGMAGGWAGIASEWELIQEEARTACAGTPDGDNIVTSLGYLAESAWAWNDSWIAVGVYDTDGAIEAAEEANDWLDKANSVMDFD